MTPKRQRFIDEYLVDLNATRAYRAAGYAGDDNVCAVEGHRLLSDPKIGEAIAAAKAERSERTRIDADWVLTRLAAEAEADMAELYDDDGRVRPIKDWPIIWRKGLVAGIEVETIGEGAGHVTKIKISDRIKRIELIGKHIDVQAFREQVAQSGSLQLTVSSEDAGL
ncbi:terminase small subunit [Candidatus Sumerlaeota bacterium]|nr:terminase small subunit [Candidatus Sumerlaeota bacterium]